MDTEKIIFIALALVFSIISMFVKAKKQRQSTSEKDIKYDHFDYEKESYQNENLDIHFQPYNTSNIAENFQFTSKKNKKKIKIQNVKNVNFQVENDQNFLQNTELENESELLEHFEGTELQKAFLYSEIFKNA
jgi:hypothetical protein